MTHSVQFVRFAFIEFLSQFAEYAPNYETGSFLSNQRTQTLSADGQGSVIDAGQTDTTGAAIDKLEVCGLRTADPLLDGATQSSFTTSGR